MATASEILARFGASLQLAAIPDAIVAKAKDHVLDTIGVAIAGLADPAARQLLALVHRWGGAPEAGVIGSGLRLPAPKAAFLNALHARVLVFDDTHDAGPAHPGAAVLAGALAAAEATDASGATVIAAVVAGYETSTRVAAALSPSHYKAGFHNTGTCSPFGAAAAAARAHNLDDARSGAALGLAGEAAIGLRQYQRDGSMLDTALNGARGAELGVAAVEMAAAGLAGPRGILDGPFGLVKVMAGGSVARLTDGLGEHWEFAGTALKPFASSRFTHGPIAALRAAHLDHRRVEEVEIFAFRQSIDVSDRPAPASLREALLSHQITAAMALIGRAVCPSDFEPLEQDVRALAERVRVRHDPALDLEFPARWPHRIVVTLTGGEQVTLDSARPPHADAAIIRSKFVSLVEPVLGLERANDIINAVDRLETLADLKPLLGPLHAGPVRAG